MHERKTQASCSCYASHPNRDPNTWQTSTQSYQISLLCLWQMTQFKKVQPLCTVSGATYTLRVAGSKCSVCRSSTITFCLQGSEPRQQCQPTITICCSAFHSEGLGFLRVSHALCLHKSGSCLVWRVLLACSLRKTLQSPTMTVASEAARKQSWVFAFTVFVTNSMPPPAHKHQSFTSFLLPMRHTQDTLPGLRPILLNKNDAFCWEVSPVYGSTKLQFLCHYDFLSLRFWPS